MINHKKTYRLCKELGILQPRLKLYPKRPKKVAKLKEITGPNQSWQMDLKYGFLIGENRFFFQISVIDVFDRTVIDYHVGLSATAKDAKAVLENALSKRGLSPGLKLPVIRTDNGPQFTANLFIDACQKWGLYHERIPVKTPNMIAYIESFHSIIEKECYRRHEFNSFKEAYIIIAQYMDFYNNRRRHGSLNYKSPQNYYQAHIQKQIVSLRMVA